MSEWYFAYGSNMNPARMKARGLSYKRAAAGRLAGFALRFDKRASGKTGVAYANIGYAPEHCVEGVLYQLASAADICLMDPYEGSPVRYSREVFPVACDQGLIPAWVYVANRAMLAEGLLPEKRYLAHLLAGKPWHSDTYQHWLMNQPVIDDDDTTPDSVAEGLIYNV